METPSALISWEDPFTPAMAARAGISRAALDRLHRDGEVRRLLRGVYLDARVRLTPEVRARAVGLRVGPRQVIARRTAAWVYGAVPPGGGELVPLDVHGTRSRWEAGPPLRPHEVVTVAGVRCTTPARTAVDLARSVAPDRALPVVDALLHTGVLDHVDLLAACHGSAGTRQSVARVRELIARADGRAAGEGESVLRLRWLEAALPTPTPGLAVAGLRVALGVRAHRFGAALSGRLSAAELQRLASAGWRVTVVPERLVIDADPVFVAGHLEREFHAHLLEQLD